MTSWMHTWFRPLVLILVVGCIGTAFLAYKSISTRMNEESVGQSIGTATMKADGTLVLMLRAEEGSGGATGDAQFVYKPTDPNYSEIIEQVGGIKPGETKEVLPSIIGDGSAPFHLPNGQRSLSGYLHDNIGKKITINGRAIDTKVGPAVVINIMPQASVETIYITNAGAAWTKDIIGKDISITGTLKKEQYIPEATNEGGAISQGTKGQQWTMSDASWSVHENGF